MSVSFKTLAGWIVVLAACPAFGQAVSGSAFEDRNGNGLKDAGEPAIPGVQVELFGTRDAGGAFDQTVASAADGSFALSPGNGCYLLRAADPPGWRQSLVRADSVIDTTPGYTFPIGYPRFAKFDQAIDRLKAGSLRYTAMGDSISTNFNLCAATETFWYAKRLRERLACPAGAGASVTLDQAGVSGQRTDDLLVNDTADLNNVFQVLALSPPPNLITISMIGNDLRDVDPSGTPTQTQVNRAVGEILDSRQNLQEVLSVFTSQIPGTDIALNTLYDNLAYDCYASDSTAFHRQWLPIINRILRELAWGQTRRASVNEVASDFAHEDQNVACTGFDQMICQGPLGFDKIHPTNDGYDIVLEKVWEAAGGINLGPKDVIPRTSIAGANYGYIRRIRRLSPTQTETRNGATAANATAALNDADGGLTASIQLGIAQEEFRLSGFPDDYDEDQIVKVVAGVRYRTSGTVTDDFYRIEAAPTGTFRSPPGYAFTTTNWNFFTPIVGGGGPNAPASNSDFPTAKLLALPNVAALREVSATLTKNPALAGGAGEYDWPAINRADLATTAVRVASAPVAATPGDLYQVELDAAWLDVYGWQKARPVEIGNVAEARLPDGTVEIAFDPLPAAQRYNLYWGRLDTLRSGIYDHGVGAPAAPVCAATTQDAGGGRLKIVVAPAAQPGVDSYLLVTSHVDGVESPTGTRSDATEIDRSQSVCN
jgi:lysophospholipase L1-like esterase